MTTCCCHPVTRRESTRWRSRRGSRREEMAERQAVWDHRLAKLTPQRAFLDAIRAENQAFVNRAIDAADAISKTIEGAVQSAKAAPLPSAKDLLTDVYVAY